MFCLKQKKKQLFKLNNHSRVEGFSCKICFSAEYSFSRRRLNDCTIRLDAVIFMKLKTYT